MRSSVLALIAITAVLVITQSASAVPTLLLEELTVPGTGGVVTSSTTLVNGDPYRIEVSGTFSAGASITADAEYSSGPDSYVWQDLVEKYESYGEGLLELRVNGAFVEWGPYNAAHVYTLDIVGDGNPLTLDIYDTYSLNNTGQPDRKNLRHPRAGSTPPRLVRSVLHRPIEATKKRLSGKTRNSLRFF